MSAEHHWTNAVAAAEHYKTHAKRLAEALRKVPMDGSIVKFKPETLAQLREALSAWEGAQ